MQNLTLLLASDGVWDLWEYGDAFEAAVQPGDPEAVGARGANFFRTSLQKGAEMFAETADNMTGIVVYFSPRPPAGAAAAPAAPAGAEGLFSV